MRLIIAKIGNDKTVSFATEELIRLIKTMDKNLRLDVRQYKEKDLSVKNALWIGLDGSVTQSEDDRILIKVENGAGIITGSNERSVLMAAYRFMYELGCRYLYPGADGEKVPKRSLDYKDIKAFVDEKPSYDHRAICIEGSVSSEHALNTIDWLPKVGMSGFFTQFFTPGIFFRRYYKRFYEDENDRDFGSEITNKEIDAIVASLLDELKKRGLVYHAVGHGWHCAPFGLDVTGWEIFEGEPEDAIKNILALKNGERAFCEGKPLNTNLCYSNPLVQQKITDYITNYCKNNPNVDYLHFWLGDAGRNHCECDECRKKSPSDFYIDMLNMLDEKMSAAGVNTKIVFLVYNDTLYPPLKERIKNQGRFTLMFAPIAHSFTERYADADLENLPPLPPYKLNEDIKRNTVANTVSYLTEWKKIFSGDSFDFDYHLMWDHHTDLGYYEVAKNLHSDMVNLHKIGLNGMVSCQLLRSAFPTGLPQYAMAKGLWSRTDSFEDVRDEYFTAAFGEDGKAVGEYLAEISDLACPAFVRGSIIPGFKDLSVEEINQRYTKIKILADEFCNKFEDKLDSSSDWQYLRVHSVLLKLFADLYIARYTGDEQRVDEIKSEFRATVKKAEPIIDAVCDDMYYCDDILDKYPDRHIQQ